MPLQHPVFDGLQLLRRAVGALHHVAVDQTAGAEERRKAGRQTGGQRGVGHALERLLAHEIWVGAIFEIHGDERQAVERNGAQRFQARNAVHFDFDRNGDQPLDFLGGVAGPLRDEFDVRRREIGIGVDRQFAERDGALDHQRERRDDDHEPLLEREANQACDHAVSLFGRIGELQEEAPFGDHRFALLQPAGDGDQLVLLRAEGHRALRELAGLPLHLHVNERLVLFVAQDGGDRKHQYVVARMPVWITASTNISFFSSPSGFCVTMRTSVVRVVGSTNDPM